MVLFMKYEATITAKTLILELLFLVGIAVLVPVVARFDFLVLGNELSENSVTEILQELSLVAAVLVMLWYAKKMPDARPALLLAAGFFASLFLREFDFLFDRTPISWAWPVSLIIAASLYHAWQHKEHALESLLSFASTRYFAYFISGFITLFVFSRLFGSGGFMWQAVMGPSYTHVFKTVIQEGLELYAYGLMAFGALSAPATAWLPQSNMRSVVVLKKDSKLGHVDA